MRQVAVIVKYTKYTLAGEIDLSGNRNLNGPLGILTKLVLFQALHL